ncbi:MAG: hypothetical protein ACREEM_09840 [Blastocatellia bacterium]
MGTLLIVFITLLAIANGTYLTRLVTERISPLARIPFGTVVGIALLAWIGFLAALLFGLNAVSIGVTVAILLLGLIALRRFIKPDPIAAEAVRVSATPLDFFYYAAWAAFLAWLFSRVVMFYPDGMHTAPANNFGDLPFHFSVITSFAFGDNLPPQSPIFAGMKFTYPFLIDFLTAFFIRCGADWRAAFFVSNLPLAFSLVCLIEFLTWKFFRSITAARLAPLIFLFNGGLGFITFIRDLGEQTTGFWQFLAHLPKAYTMNNDLVLGGSAIPLRWGNIFTTLLIPQRSMLFGLPIVAMILMLWWLAVEETRRQGDKETRRQGDKETGRQGDRETGRQGDKETRRQGDEEMSNEKAISPSPLPLVPLSPLPLVPLSPCRRYFLAAGLLAGMLPMLHAHGFLSVMMVSLPMALLFFSWEWLAFFIPAGLLALPQALYLSGTPVKIKLAEKLFHWEAGESNPLVFWLVNAGVMIALVLAALLIKRFTTARQARFYLPFILWFLAPNIWLFAPWPWDNIKIFVYWSLVSTPFVANVLGTLLNQRRIVLRAAATALLVALTLTGAIDVLRALSPAEDIGLFSKEEMEVAALLRAQTPPNAVILHAPIHNSVVALSGRRSVMGYPGHLWTHGIEYGKREADVKAIYRGGVGAINPLKELGVDYLIIGPRERSEMEPDENFFANLYPIVIDHAEYRVFQINGPSTAVSPH